MRAEVFYRDGLATAQAKAFYTAMQAQTAAGNVGGIFRLTPQSRGSAIGDAFDALCALRLDRPDYFHLGRRNIAHQEGGRLCLVNAVQFTPAQTARLTRLLGRTVEALTAGTGGLPDRRRAWLIYSRVARRMSYADRGDDLDHSVAGPLLRKTGVCEAYSCLLTLALRAAGIPCIKVSGLGRNEPHCWNLAWLDGAPRHLDVTWETVSRGRVSGNYFALRDGEITRDHIVTTRGLPQENTNGRENTHVSKCHSGPRRG